MAAQKSKALKIGFVLDDGLDKPGGVQEYILAIGQWLRAQGHEVLYLVGQTSRTDIAGVHSMSRNMRVRFNGNSLSMPLPTSKSRLRKFLQAEQFDVLHIQVPYSPFMAQRLILASNLKRTAIVGTFHIAPNSRLVSIGSWALGRLLRPSLKHFDAMLSVSPTAADFARATFGTTSEISPNVIDYQRFHNAKPLKKYQDETLTILFLGRLVPRKGCMLLLKAVAGLAKYKDLPGFRVVICGTGPLEQKLRKYIGEHGLNGKVELVGFVTETDKPRYYASADISVFPSNGGESFGIVLLEAMAGGRAAILAGDNPGYRSVLESKPELLFDPGDAGELTGKLASYLKDAGLRRELQLWGAGFAKQFDVGVVGRQLLSVYGKALHKRQNP
jgi:phosphatidylinositol alpha-mannosyltransferase